MPFLTGLRKKKEQVKMSYEEWMQRQPAPPQPTVIRKPDLPSMMGGGLFLPKLPKKKGKKKEFNLTDTTGDWDIIGGGF